MEACLKIPEVRAFDQDVLLLIVPNSAHTQYTPITLGTLHIDMAIKLAIEEELKTLNKQWQGSSVATKLTKKEAQVLNIEEAQIVSKLDSNVKLVKDTIIGPFGTVEVKGVLRKIPNHYKRINVVVNDLRENQYCKDIAVVHQLQILKPRSDRVLVVLQNLSGRTLKLKRGTSVAYVEASQVVPPLDGSLKRGNIYEKVARDITKESQSEDSPGKDDERVLKILEKLDLAGIESWTEQQ